MNDLTEGFPFITKGFVDDSSLFFVIDDMQTSPNNLNKDLEILSN